MFDPGGVGEEKKILRKGLASWGSPLHIIDIPRSKTNRGTNQLRNGFNRA